MNITELEEWCLSQPEIKSVETAVSFYPLGHYGVNDISPITEMRTTIVLADGEEWNDLCGRTGADYRADEAAMDIMCQTSQMVIQRFLDSRGTANAEEDT